MPDPNVLVIFIPTSGAITSPHSTVSSAHPINLRDSTSGLELAPYLSPEDAAPITKNIIGRYKANEPTICIFLVPIDFTKPMTPQENEPFLRICGNPEDGLLKALNNHPNNITILFIGHGNLDTTSAQIQTNIITLQNRVECCTLIMNHTRLRESTSTWKPSFHIHLFHCFSGGGSPDHNVAYQMYRHLAMHNFEFTIYSSPTTIRCCEIADQSDNLWENSLLFHVQYLDDRGFLQKVPIFFLPPIPNDDIRLTAIDSPIAIKGIYLIIRHARHGWIEIPGGEIKRAFPCLGTVHNPVFDTRFSLMITGANSTILFDHTMTDDRLFRFFLSQQHRLFSKMFYNTVSNDTMHADLAWFKTLWKLCQHYLQKIFTAENIEKARRQSFNEALVFRNLFPFILQQPTTNAHMTTQNYRPNCTIPTHGWDPIILLEDIINILQTFPTGIDDLAIDQTDPTYCTTGTRFINYHTSHNRQDLPLDRYSSRFAKTLSEHTPAVQLEDDPSTRQRFNQTIPRKSANQGSVVQPFPRL